MTGSTPSHGYSFVSYTNYLNQQQCLTLPPAEEVACVSQHLNITEPPSVYTYTDYTSLWDPVTCLLWNVTLHERIDAAGAFNYCTVPLRGSDGFLFVSLALLFTAALFGKLSAVWVLISGAVLGVMNYYVNMLEISNAISIWLSIQPADLFFYAFLPPLLVDQAIRIDFFMFRKIWIHALLMAFVMVILSAIILTPIILFVLGFADRGWSWVYGGLFSAIVSPTDALAVAAILKRANGPERLNAIMDGESLFNDASAITLFEVFSHVIHNHMDNAAEGWPSVWSVIPTILLDIVKLSAIGVSIGLAFSIATGYMLRWLRWRGAAPYMETTVVLSVAYLSFYVSNSPAGGSGVISVVCFGLYGNATSKWGMLASAEENGGFDAVWDMISFAANGLVFFWSGIASVNFFIRSLESYDQSTMSLAAIPLIYIFMMLIRTGCVALFNPLFKALGQGLSVGEVFFVGWAGLRGSVSLIMVSAFASGSRLTFMNTKNAGGYSDAAVVSSDISLWVPCFVVLTLVINGPTIAPVLRLLRLNRVPLEKQKMRAKAKRGLCRFTDWQLADLRENEDEFLQGANWDAVAQYVDMSNKLRDFDMPHDKGGSVSSEVASQDLKTASGVARVLWRGMLRAFRRALLPVLCCFRRRNEEVGEVSAYKKKAKPKESGSPPEDSAFDSSSGGGDPGGEYSAPRPFSLSAISMGLWRDSPPSGESEERDHDAWSDVSATDLAADLAEECPFLLRQSAAAFLPRGSMAYPADGAGGDGSNGDGDVDLELGLQRDTAMEGLSNGVAQPVAEMETFLSISGKRGSTSNLMTITEGQPAHHPDPEPPTTAAAAAPADGEMCISGTASAKLLKELRQALSSERNGTADVPGYYASVPGPVGAQMRQELAAELEQDRPATQGPSLDDDEDLGGGGKTAYYSSLPTAVGRQLQNELRAALGVSGTHRRSASGGGSGPSSPPQSPRSRLVSQFEPDTEPAQKPLGLERLSSAARSGAASPRAGPGNAAYLDRTSMSATASMPAAVGRLMQAQLKARMLQRDSAPGSPNGSRASSPRAGSVPPPVEWDSYHATVSGVAGSNLAAEVRHHLRKPSLGDEPTRDLLGRRLPPRSGVTSPFDLPPLPPAPLSARGAPPVHASMHARSASMQAVRFNPESGRFDTPVAEALLRKRPNLHAMKRSSTLPSRQASGAVSIASSAHGEGSLDSTSPLPTGRSSPGVASSVSARQLRTSRSSASRSRAFERPSGGEQSFDSSPSEAPQMSVLARTFSVGKSMHHLKSRKGLGSMSSEVDGDEESQGPLSARTAGEDGSRHGGGDLAAVSSIPKSASEATIRDGSEESVSEACLEEGSRIAFFAERRTRLLAGLKRYFVGKRLNGLLSVEGLRILQYACDKAADDPETPLSVWTELQKEIGGRWGTRLASRMLFSMTRGFRNMPKLLQRMLGWPYKKLAGLIRRFLGRKMLVACEVAVEFYLGVTNSHQVNWLKGHANECWVLLGEIDTQAEAAYAFIIEKEIEAPDRFQAIQSYRAAMALLRMQLHYVEELFETGMIDEAEHHSMADPIDKKTRHLEIVGPVWRPPPPKAVLRSLPLIASLSEPSFRRIWEAGALREFRSGQVIWTATDLVRRTACAQGPGAFVVLSGVVKRVYIRPDGTRREYFQSAGGVVGVLLCSTGSKLPGTEIAIAEGNTLGKGPVVFHVPQPYVKTILVRAAQGDGEMNRIVEELLRLSAAYVVESMQPDMVETVSNHMAAVMEPAAAAQDGDDGTPLPASMQQTPPPSGGPPGRSPLYRQSSGGPLQRRTSSQQGLGGVSLERRSMMHPGVAPATTGATGAAPLPSGPGLVSVKSVGMNLAAMMQDIAQLEYDELDDTTTAEEEKAELEAARTRASQRSIRAGRQSIAAAAALEADDEDPLQPRRASSPSRRAVQFQVETSRSRNLSLRRASLAAAAAEHAPQVAADLALEMRRCLHYALVIRLTPGESMVQTSHVVLVAGELSPERGSAAERCFAQDVSAPWVLPWMWNTSQLCNACAIVPMVPQLKWTAGPEGATVVVCHQADGSVPPWVEEWHDAKSHADAKDKLTSFPLGADGGIASSGASVSDQGDAGLGRAASTPGGSEQGSLMGSAAAAMGRELGSMMSFLRRNKAETPRKMNAR